VDVRLIATTNRDLKAEVDAGKFRSDLYYRLNVVPIRTPPLRERVQDIPRLVHHFIQRMAEQQGTAVLAIPPETIHLLQSYSWPGNVRELANAIERAVILCRGSVLLPSAFDEYLQEAAAPSAPAARVATAPAAMPTAAAGEVLAERLPFALEEIERRAIERALEAAGGNRTRAAKLLGISERTLRNRLNTPRPMISETSRRPA